MKYRLVLICFLLVSLLIMPAPAKAEVIDYHQWESIEQFTQWYQDQGFTILWPPNNNCGDYARWVQVTALRQGYAISQQLVDFRGQVYGVYVGPANHIGNLIIVDKKAYYVEPKIDKFKVQFITDIK